MISRANQITAIRGYVNRRKIFARAKLRPGETLSPLSFTPPLNLFTATGLSVRYFFLPFFSLSLFAPLSFLFFSFRLSYVGINALLPVDPTIRASGVTGRARA